MVTVHLFCASPLNIHDSKFGDHLAARLDQKTGNLP